MLLNCVSGDFDKFLLLKSRSGPPNNFWPIPVGFVRSGSQFFHPMPIPYFESRNEWRTIYLGTAKRLERLMLMAVESKRVSLESRWWFRKIEVPITYFRLKEWVPIGIPSDQVGWSRTKFPLFIYYFRNNVVPRLTAWLRPQWSRCTIF